MKYWHLFPDALGSVDGIGDGNTEQRAHFTPFGRRIDDALYTPAGPPVAEVHEGFTGHEHDETLGVINMGGRIYDPTLRSFWSPDPIVSAPLNGQSYNPYTYVVNNPLRYVDPSGLQYRPAGCGNAVSSDCPAVSDLDDGDRVAPGGSGLPEGATGASPGNAYQLEQYEVTATRAPPAPELTTSLAGVSFGDTASDIGGYVPHSLTSAVAPRVSVDGVASALAAGVAELGPSGALGDWAVHADYPGDWLFQTATGGHVLTGLQWVSAGAAVLAGGYLAATAVAAVEVAIYNAVAVSSRVGWVLGVGIPAAGGMAARGVKAINLPSWRKLTVNMAHIVERHMEGGAYTEGRTVFAGMNYRGVTAAIRQAYQASSTVVIQGERILLSGVTKTGLTVEMWFNRTTKTIETAYPVVGR